MSLVNTTDATEEDLEVLRSQLGRVPRGVVGIAARCVCGRPTVVDPGPQYQDSALAAAAASTGPARPWVQQLGILVGKADQPPSATPIPSAETSQSGQAPTTSQESGE